MDHLRSLMDWMDDAACKDMPGFSEEDPPLLLRGICACCPVKLLCKSYARMFDEWGLWGGETWHDRQRAYKKETKTRVITQATTTFRILYDRYKAADDFSADVFSDARHRSGR